MTRAEAERAGRRAETAAALLLRLKGYAILDRRARTPFGEIDLVARRGDVVAFVEVKLRASRLGADLALTRRQRQRIAKAAQAWMQARRDMAGAAIRFDLVQASGLSLRHIPDAWRDGD